MRKKIINKGDESELQGRRVIERLGVLPNHIDSTQILFHCASVGEINVAAPLIGHLFADDSELRVTISTTSLTGAVLAKKLFGDRVQHCFLPFDLPIFVNKFLRRLSPALLVVTEVEFWPNLLQQAYKKKIASVLINGRISSKSVSTYMKLHGIYKHTLRKFDIICAQSQLSYDNFLRIGVYQARLQLTNNIKFDLQKHVSDDEKAQQLLKLFDIESDKIMVGASTHEPEEQLLLATFSLLRQENSNLKLVLVPRHPHRFDEVFTLCKATGLSVNRLSTTDSLSTEPSDIWVIDKMGWLKACYALCQFAFIGGSFAQKGGHNALECALYAKPMAMGPSIFNNPEICNQLASVDALAICQSHDEMTDVFQALQMDRDLANKQGLAGANLLASNAGATEKTLNIIKTLI
ncbi:MAG: 3-deoxy-D-manno-octulosonic acid transferase [Pseudomonadota bacterium]